MKIDFKIYELTEEFGTYEFSHGNEFIKVGEVMDHDEPHFLLQGIMNGALTLIPGLNIQESAYKVPIDIVKLKGDEYCSDYYTFEIHKEYLTLDIAEEIQRLNEEY